MASAYRHWNWRHFVQGLGEEGEDILYLEKYYSKIARNCKVFIIYEWNKQTRLTGKET